MLWRSLLQNWLQQQAHSKIYEQLAAGASKQSPDDATTGEPIPCDVGLVFALGIEAGGLEDLMSGVLTTRAAGSVVRQGELGTRGLTIVEAGVGCEAARHGTELLLSGHRPRWIISAGFAGGLDARLKRSDIVMADSLVGPDGNRLSLDLKVDAASLSATPGVHMGRIVTVSDVVGTPEEKRALGTTHDALAVDMESWGAADACRQAQVRCLCVRVISDTIDEEMPKDIGNLAKQKSLAGQLGAATSALWRRPSSFKDMWRLKETALVCSDRLAKFLAAVIPRLD